MKANLALKLSSSAAALALISASLTGCQSGPSLGKNTSQNKTPSGPALVANADAAKQASEQQAKAAAKPGQPVIDESLPQPVQQPAPAVKTEPVLQPVPTVEAQPVPQPVPSVVATTASQPLMNENTVQPKPAAKSSAPVIDETLPQTGQPAVVKPANQPAFDDSKIAAAATAQTADNPSAPKFKEIPPAPVTNALPSGPQFTGDDKMEARQTASRPQKTTDWNSRVGNYTFAEAVAELGRPNRQTRMSDGRSVYKWFMQPVAVPRVNSGMSYHGNTGFGQNQNIGARYTDHVLQLTFTTNGVLAAWTKNY